MMLYKEVFFIFLRLATWPRFHLQFISTLLLLLSSPPQALVPILFSVSATSASFPPPSLLRRKVFEGLDPGAFAHKLILGGDTGC